MRNDLLKDLYENDRHMFDHLNEELRDAVLSASHEYTIWLLQGGLSPRSETEFQTYQERLEAASHSDTSDVMTGRINTYPFGTPTKDIFPEFIGICAGSERLSRVLDQAVRQCRQMQKKFSWDTPKSVIILTDKWNDPIFQDKYERTFIRFALDTNVMFVFLLVTAYGIVRIPFLAQTRKDLKQLQCRHYWIENNPAEDIKRLLFTFPFARYHYDGGTWGRFRENAAADYRFDFKHGICYISKDSYGENKETAIPVSARRRFIRRIVPLYYESEHAPDPVLVHDGSNHTACLFGLEFCWCGPASAQPEFYQELARAFEELITECEKSNLGEE